MRFRNSTDRAIVVHVQAVNPWPDAFDVDAPVMVTCPPGGISDEIDDRNPVVKQYLKAGMVPTLLPTCWERLLSPSPGDEIVYEGP